MKLVTFVKKGVRRVGCLRGDKVVDLGSARVLQLTSSGLSEQDAVTTASTEIPECMTSVIQGGERTLAVMIDCESFAIAGAEEAGLVERPEALKLLTPIPKPPVILNMGNAYRPQPLGDFTFKPLTGLIGPEDPIVIPREISDFGACYECEIGVVIGKRGRRIPNDDTAYEYVYGYVVYNDVTDYGKQISGTFGSKLHDTFCPVGPWLVTRDEISDPYDLVKRTWVNGMLATERKTAGMLHRIPEFLHLASKTLTLLPGTIVSTGAPDTGRIMPGDVVEMEITGLGRLRNPVVKEE